MSKAFNEDIGDFVKELKNAFKSVLISEFDNIELNDGAIGFMGVVESKFFDNIDYNQLDCDLKMFFNQECYNDFNKQQRKRLLSDMIRNDLPEELGEFNKGNSIFNNICCFCGILGIAVIICSVAGFIYESLKGNCNKTCEDTATVFFICVSFLSLACFAQSCLNSENSKIANFDQFTIEDKRKISQEFTGFFNDRLGSFNKNQQVHIVKEVYDYFLYDKNFPKELVSEILQYMFVKPDYITFDDISLAINYENHNSLESKNDLSEPLLIKSGKEYFNPSESPKFSDVSKVVRNNNIKIKL